MQKIAVFVLFFTVSGCTLFQPKIEIREVQAAVVCDVTDKPDALDLKNTPPTLVMNDAQVWGYWFSADLYAALAENIQAMRRWMKQSSAIRSKLVECIESHNSR